MLWSTEAGYVGAGLEGRGAPRVLSVVFVCGIPGSCGPCDGAEGGPRERRLCGIVGIHRAGHHCAETGGSSGRTSAGSGQDSWGRGMDAHLCVSACEFSACHSCK